MRRLNLRHHLERQLQQGRKQEAPAWRLLKDPRETMRATSKEISKMDTQTRPLQPRQDTMPNRLSSRLTIQQARVTRSLRSVAAEKYHMDLYPVREPLTLFYRCVCWRAHYLASKVPNTLGSSCITTNHYRRSGISQLFVRL